MNVRVPSSSNYLYGARKYTRIRYTSVHVQKAIPTVQEKLKKVIYFQQKHKFYFLQKYSD